VWAETFCSRVAGGLLKHGWLIITFQARLQPGESGDGPSSYTRIPVDTLGTLSLTAVNSGDMLTEEERQEVQGLPHTL